MITRSSVDEYLRHYRAKHLEIESLQYYSYVKVMDSRVLLKIVICAFVMSIGSSVFASESCAVENIYHHEYWESATLEQVQACIDSGTKPNRTHELDGGLLHFAILYNSDPDVTQALIQAGADINKYNFQHQSPLHIATTTDYPENLRVLLDAGPDLSALTGNGNSAIHFGARNSPNKENIEILLEYGFGVDQQNGYGETPIFLAVQNRNSPGVLRALVEADANVNVTIRGGMTALHRATDMIGGLDHMEILLAAGIDPNSGLHNSVGALYFATFPSSDNEEFIKVMRLVEFGADLDRPVGFGDYILHALIYNGIPTRNHICPDVSPIIAMMIEKGADPDQLNRRGETAQESADFIFEFDVTTKAKFIQELLKL